MPLTHADISTNISTIYQRIRDAAQAAGRNPHDVTLELAVKTQTVDTCVMAARALRELGHPVVLGQNRVQEAVAMHDAVMEAVPETKIHIIGPVQTNNINHALRSAHLIETIDSVRTANKFDSRVHEGGPLPVFLQVNTSGEETKSGCSPAEAFDVACHIASSENLELRGFMTIGAHTTDEALVRASFSSLRELRDRCLASEVAGLANAHELSMGMTADMELAISEGATIVRVGTAVFGARN